MKQYLTIHHRIQELIGFVTGIASLIVAIVMMGVIKHPIPVNYDLAGNVTKYGSVGVVIMMPVILLPTILILLAATHLFPLSMWSLPVKPKPGREVIIYRLSAYLVTLYTMITGIYSLVSVFCMGFGWTWLFGKASIALCVSMLVIVVVVIVLSIRANR